MKNYLDDCFCHLKRAVVNDYVNLYLVSASMLLYVIVFSLWKFRLSSLDIFLVTLGGIYPIRYLTIIFVLNSVLAISSYGKEKEISYLLFAANVFLTLLILILEIFYLTHLN